MAPKSQTEQKRKKQRVEQESPLESRWFDKETATQLRKDHDESGPYRHVVLEDLCTNKGMRSIHDEITVNMKANFKETDLFKVFQTGDLAALTPKEEEAMPHLMSLRKAIYSNEFREFVSNITGCGELTDRVDCSCNAYAHSCHLLCHDDVIGTRRVSYIIYLSDPDDPWQVVDGGAVELYPLLPSSVTKTNAKDGSEGVVQGIPSNVPTRTLLPTFNTMLIFTVQPGRSYHSVQEVFSQSKPRLSISGWYHAAAPPVGSDMSSLKQIMTLGDDHREFASFSADGADATTPTLSKSELKELGKWINPTYLTPATMKDINEQFCANSSLQLNDFIRPDAAYALTKALIIADETQQCGHGTPQLNYELGASAHWELVGPPHKRRHLLYATEAAEATNGSHSSGETALSDAVGERLDAIRREVFRSPLFARYLQIVTSLQPLGYKDEVRRFRPGLDYTVAHYGVLTKQPRLDATLCFVNDDAELQERVMKEHRTSGTKAKNSAEGKAAPKGLSKASDKSSKGDEDDKKGNTKAGKQQASNAEEEEEDEDEEEDVEMGYDEVWDGGEVGGFECYIEAEEDPENAEAAEVYRTSYNRDNVAVGNARKGVWQSMCVETLFFLHGMTVEYPVMKPTQCC